MMSLIALALVAATLPASATNPSESETTRPTESSRMEAGFRNPPAEAGPWTYWFWINGNISRDGITADLEAMARVGIRGVLIMEVAGKGRFAPAGPVAFGSPDWREMFRHAVAEACRLGLQVSMNNDAGWCGSGGPWNVPEYSMQKLVSTKTRVRGGGHFEGILPKPKETAGFYRDVRVLAYPEPYRNEDKLGVAPDAVIDLSDKMDAAGKLVWDAPAATWIVLRIGHTSTGRKNRPAPAAGEGLECDKFGPAAVKRHFEGFVAKLADDVGPAAGTTFTMTHIDSWEVGDQNWTRRMPEEFRRRRGYDLTPWLVALAGGPAVGDAEQTERFRRDFLRTRAELTAEAYAGALRGLAHSRGLRLSIEGYGPTGATIDPLSYGAQADLPMGEFWVMRWGAWHLLSSRLMASVAHTSGKRVVGAESFTTIGQNDAWTEHPYSLKTTGDWAFCEGINRFVFHRYALQPWTAFAPGMTMSHNGTHFDRTQTWWDQSAAWIHYLARCQYLLQEGTFAADVCRLLPDGENYGHSPKMATLPEQYAALPPGYNYDYVADETLMAGASVQEGKVLLDSGVSYRLIQLPNHETMTPQLLRKLRELVRAGAVVWGPRPRRSPSLTDYPQCDRDVERLAAELWGSQTDETAGEHRLGPGRVIWARSLEEVLGDLAGGPDFAFRVEPQLSEAALESPTIGRGSVMGKERPGLMPTAGLNWIHRRIGRMDLYFVANPQHRPVESLCNFRVTGKRPELWDPANGEIRRPAVFTCARNFTEVPIHFDQAGSVFVVFRDAVLPGMQIITLSRGDETLYEKGQRKLHRLPLLCCENGSVRLLTPEGGHYQLGFADGRTRRISAPAPPASLSVPGPWKVSFQSGGGAPPSLEFPVLKDWSQHENEGIRYFSGTASYRTQFQWNMPATSEPLCWQLDLGDIRVIAEVKLNGHDLGVLWKPPFMVEVTPALQPGRNELEIPVTNLWPNRLIGDEQYPDDCTPDGTWTTGPIPAWPDWLLQGRPRPEPRRVTFTTWKYYTKDSALLASGVLGPVTLRAERAIFIRGQ